MRAIPFALQTTFCLMLGTGSALAETLYYPNQKNVEFTLEVPDDWDQSKEKDDDGILRITVTGDNGAAFQVAKTDITSENDLESFIADTIKGTRDYLKENYKDVKFENPKIVEKDDNAGVATYVGGGKAISKDDGKVYVFESVLVAGKERVIEFWLESAEDDKEAGMQLEEIAKSFKKAGGA